jgi:hypothetical protein
LIALRIGLGLAVIISLVLSPLSARDDKSDKKAKPAARTSARRRMTGEYTIFAAAEGDAVCALLYSGAPNSVIEVRQLASDRQHCPLVESVPTWSPQAERIVCLVENARVDPLFASTEKAKTKEGIESSMGYSADAVSSVLRAP